MERKTCRSCEQVLAATDFDPAGPTAAGMASRRQTCRKCRDAERRRERYRTDPVYRALRLSARRDARRARSVPARGVTVGCPLAEEAAPQRVSIVTPLRTGVD